LSNSWPKLILIKNGENIHVKKAIQD